MWAAVELRRRWRGLVVLGLLAGVTAGLAMASVVSARRTGTAWERLRAVTLASDAMVFGSQVGLYSDEELDYDHIAGLPYVEAAGAFGLAYAAEGEVFMASFGPWLDTVDRPRIVRGRSPHPDDPTEVVVSAPGPRALGERSPPSLGERFTLTFLTRAQQLENRYETPEGPTVTFRVVGISDSPFEIGAIPSHGDVFVGPAFRQRYGSGLASFSNLAVRLADPARDLERLEAEVARHYPGRNVPVYDLSAAGKRVTNGTNLERSGLLLFAAAVALAGLVIVGQALTRSVRAAGADVAVLVAIGFTRRDAARALALPYVLTVSVATVVGLAVAILLSPRFPIGLGRRVDPDVGLIVDTAVLVPATLVFSGVLFLAVAATSWRASSGVDQDLAARPSKTVALLTRLGAPVVAVTGARLALERGRGRRSLPTRPALLAAVFGVLASVGAFTIGTGMGDAVERGELFGSVWDVEAYLLADEPNEEFRALPGVLAADAATTAVARVAREQVAIGDIVLPIYAVDEVKGSVQFVVLDGSPPRRRGDVMLGPDSARRLGLEVGEELMLGRGQRFRVVGTGLLPTTPHSSFDQGAWVVAEDIARAAPQASSGAEAGSGPAAFDRGFVAARLSEKTDVDAAVARVTASAGDGFFVDRPLPPADQQNLRNVRGLPLLFAAFATVLAVGALAHVSVSVLRRRRLDLAVLRALGCTPLQVRGCLAWQAITLAVLGLVVGVPSGVALGRTVWRVVTRATPMVYVEPVNALALVLVVPVAVVLANVIAAWPGQRAARMPLAPALRAE
jgi:hypothetical protein